LQRPILGLNLGQVYSIYMLLLQGATDGYRLTPLVP